MSSKINLQPCEYACKSSIFQDNQLILLKLVDRLINDNIDIVYIVPTLSLLNQVTEDFNRELKKVGVTDYWISNSFDDQQLSNKKNIYIMTQEKAIEAEKEVKEEEKHEK